MTGKWLTLIKVGFSSVQKLKNECKLQSEFWNGNSANIGIQFFLLNSIITVYGVHWANMSLFIRNVMLRTLKRKQKKKQKQQEQQEQQSVTTKTSHVIQPFKGKVATKVTNSEALASHLLASYRWL